LAEKNMKRRTWVGFLRLWIAVAIVLLPLVLVFVAPAKAACSQPVACSSVVPGASNAWWQTTDFSTPTKTYFETVFFPVRMINHFYSQLIVGDLWDNNARPALKGATAQLAGTGAYLTGIIGGFLDAQTSIESQLALQVLQARAVKDYTPGENLCRFGTNVRTLAAAQTRADEALVALSSMAQARQLGTRGGSSDTGVAMDIQSRFNQYRNLYCDPADNGGLNKSLCGGSSPTSVPKRFNKDINFTRTVDVPLTLDLDFGDGTLTADEEDVIAMSNNLYGHEVFGRLGDLWMASRAGNADNKVVYLDLRQIIAWRNVATNSFNAQVAARAKGDPGSGQFLRNALREMGMSDAEAKQYLDAGTNAPSLEAQMEILTKKMYQNPNFFVNLVDKPANVGRQTAAMQAISLMQDRDVYQSLERQEMLLSVLLEIRTARAQREVEGRLMGLGAQR
jgi:hypothetical protein